VRVRNKLLSGVGINDADYRVVDASTGFRCPFYEAWASMLKRCYSEKFHIKHPTYIGCEVCEDWKVFSKFKLWMETQDWEGKQLDKDLLVMGNKVYSPTTCLFVSGDVNCFMTEKQSTNGPLPPGVAHRKDNGKYRAYCSQHGKGLKHLGQYDTPEEAQRAYKLHKANLAIELADLQTDPRISAALLERYKLTVDSCTDVE
jgi:hypothetical protein